MLRHHYFAPNSPLWGRNPRAMAAQWRLFCVVFAHQQPQKKVAASSGPSQPTPKEVPGIDMLWEGCPNCRD